MLSGSLLIVLGLYCVLWGKSKEIKHGNKNKSYKTQRRTRKREELRLTGGWLAEDDAGVAGGGSSKEDVGQKKGLGGGVGDREASSMEEG
ncbi:hypothetical protein L1887_33032 [Cichorium endivia]|nr:hypothetical protein L1887_33032 [Cichorium endivia]